MLTDRQQKFYTRITELGTSKEISRKEKHFISKAKRNIDDGRPFGDSINAMNLSLRIYQESDKKELSSDVKTLYDDLIKAYGEPDFRQLAKMRTKGTMGAGFQDNGWF
jgi:predicted lipid-binding transport protein (Tim44 family)